MTRFAAFRALVAATLLVAVQAQPQAQDWPTRPVTMVVPFAAGGPTDLIGRMMTPRMSEVLGQQIVIENMGGAGGMTGASRVARAAPDGYQFVLSAASERSFSISCSTRSRRSTPRPT
jgi:tripartite-type tricarboxylate transporter receptor subunit TctC